MVQTLSSTFCSKEPPIPESGKGPAGKISGPRNYFFKEISMSKREVIEPNKGDKRYARRDAQGQFTESQVNVGRSLAADRRSKSKTVAPKGQGDRGDQKKS